FLKFRMVITRLAELRTTFTGNLSNLHHRDAVAQKSRNGNFFRLERIIRKLNTKRNTQSFPLGRIQSQREYGIKVEFAVFGLHIAPIAAYVEHVNERQTRHFLNMLRNRLAPLAGGDRWATLLPAVTDQPKPGIANRLLRRSS